MGAMAPINVQQAGRRVWALARKQHGVITRAQLFALGYSVDAIRHRIDVGRLYTVHAGVYAVGRPGLTEKGRWMAAVLSCGPRAALSHLNAAVFLGIRSRRPRVIDVSVPAASNPRPQGVRVHRRTTFEVTRRSGIPVTTPIQTLIDCATVLSGKHVTAMINEADARDLVRADQLAGALPGYAGQRGVPLLRAILDPTVFALTHSELERMFLPLARRAGLPKPETQRVLGTDRVDFFWSDLDLVVEADSLTYHRTALQQSRDTERDHAHFAAERLPLRFTHHQIARRQAYVVGLLRDVRRRLLRTPGRPRAA
jgi:very-short-patch-repair endonuclease